MRSGMQIARQLVLSITVATVALVVGVCNPSAANAATYSGAGAGPLRGRRGLHSGECVVSMNRVLRLVLMLMVLPLLAQASTYWVDGTNGSNSNGCNTSATPLTTTAKLTIQAGFGCLSVGDTLRVRGGDYTESFVIRDLRGSSWSNPTIIEAETPGTVTWFAQSNRVFIMGVDNSQYVIVRGFMFDGSTGKNDLVAAGKTTLPVTYAERLLGVGCTDGQNPSTCSTHIRYENNIIRNSSYIAAELCSTYCTDVEFLNNEFYNIGKVENSAGVYNKAARTTFVGNYFHDINSSGINFWNEDTAVVNDGIARNNRLERNGYWWAPTAENGTPEQGSSRYQGGTYNIRYGNGIFISRGSGTQVYNNIIIDTVGAIIAGYGARDCLIANNTIYGNPVGGSPGNIEAGLALVSQDGGSTNCVVRNNIVYQPGVTIIPPIIDQGVNNTLSHNLCSSSASGCTIVGNPQFLNPSSHDFQIRQGSEAVDNGTTINTVTQDFDSISRPQGSSHDIGAYEYRSLGSQTYTLSIPKSSYSAGEAISVSWTVSPAPGNPKDWIGFYLFSNADNTKFIAADGAGDPAWTYTNGQNAGTFTIIAPSTPGTYEFRYLLNNGYTHVSASPKISVTISSVLLPPSKLRIIP